MNPLDFGKSQAEDREYGFSKATVCPWDWSEEPKDNTDREKKLGSGDQTPYGAIAAFDKDTQAVTPANGFHGQQISSIWPLDPDFWTLRLHTPRGEGVDNTWAPRGSVDHDHNDYERDHRSSMVIDQSGKQTWAWRRDLERMIKLMASVSHEELVYDSAGFLSMIRSNDVATGATRGALALQWNKRAGYYADGRYAAMLWHVLSIRPPGGGGTTTDGESTADVTPAPGGVRGDVPFHCGSFLAPLAFGYGCETDGYVYGGKHWLHVPASFPPNYEPMTDPKSNQTLIPREEDRGVWVYILKPPENVPTGAPTPGREFPPPAGVSVVDTKTMPSGAGGSGGGFTYGNFPAGLNTDEYLLIPIPEVGGPSDLRVLVSWRPSVLLAGAETIELALVYKVVVDGAIPAAPSMVTKQLTIADNPALVTDLQTMEWTIPNITSGPMHGGFIALEFFRRGREATDTFPGVFKQAGGARVHFKPSAQLVGGP